MREEFLNTVEDENGFLLAIEIIDTHAIENDFVGCNQRRERK